MSVDFQGVGDYVFHTVIVPHRLYFVDYCMLARGTFAKNLVIVTRDEEVRYGITAPDLDLAVVASEDKAVSGLHQGHRHGVVGDVDGVV